MKTKHKEKICDLILQHSIDGEEILFFDKAGTMKSVLPSIFAFILKFLLFAILTVSGLLLFTADIDLALYA